MIGVAFALAYKIKGDAYKCKQYTDKYRPFRFFGAAWNYGHSIRVYRVNYSFKMQHAKNGYNYA